MGNKLLTDGGKIFFDWKHLTPTYSGRLLGRVYDLAETPATGAHSALGIDPRHVSASMGHEAHHIWQSRSMGDAFIFNYAMQMINALTVGENPFQSANYFEAQAYGDVWNY